MAGVVFNSEDQGCRAEYVRTIAIESGDSTREEEREIRTVKWPANDWRTDSGTNGFVIVWERRQMFRTGHGMYSWCMLGVDRKCGVRPRHAY